MVSTVATTCLDAACDGLIFWDTPGSGSNGQTPFTFNLAYNTTVNFNENRAGCSVKKVSSSAGNTDDRLCDIAVNKYICELTC